MPERWLLKKKILAAAAVDAAHLCMMT